MNVHAIRAIYLFEMARTFRTLLQSILAPVISTSLYFLVFGSAIGSRMQQVEGVHYAAFIIPGLTMLSVLSESISNASFGIYMPRFAGTIYEVLSAPISVPWPIRRRRRSSRASSSAVRDNTRKGTPFSASTFRSNARWRESTRTSPSTPSPRS